MLLVYFPTVVVHLPLINRISCDNRISENTLYSEVRGVVVFL